ncbi:MAG: methyltransferase domain-containing protein [Lachnospiraceae bacterium]|nr:methyltransferase domain-containing protein [Lachnospiraceae bacterium]
MDMSSQKYNEAYYKTHCGKNYERNNGWEEIFAGYAQHIVRELNPHSVLDVGCACGYMVESLRDRGVDAEGMDISEYALSCVREDIKPYCFCQSAVVPIKKKYDLITCIEVLEHLEAEEIPAAIENLCSAADTVLFSSTPFDYGEESHVSVHDPEFWVEQFSYCGFYHDVQYDCAYLSVQAMLFRRGDKNKVDLIREYEHVLFQKHQANVALRQQLKVDAENVNIYKEAYQKHVDMINEELNPKIAELTQKLGSCEEEQKVQYEKQLEEQKAEYEKQLEEQKAQSEKQLEGQKAQSEKQLKEQKAQYEKQLEEQEKEYLRKMEEQETRFRESFDNEVEKRKHYEERCRVNQQVSKELETYKIEKEQSRHALEFLKSSNNEKSGKAIYTMGLKEFLKAKYEWIKENRRLQARDKRFWDPVFNPDYYAMHNPDIQSMYGGDDEKLLKHFICMGMIEGRRANAEFDVNVYMNYNPDVVEKLGFDTRAYYLHYISEGQKAGRRSI